MAPGPRAVGSFKRVAEAMKGLLADFISTSNVDIHSQQDKTHHSRARTATTRPLVITAASECRHYDGRHHRHSACHVCMYHGGVLTTTRSENPYVGSSVVVVAVAASNRQDRHPTSPNRPESKWSWLANVATTYRRVKVPAIYIDWDRPPAIGHAAVTVRWSESKTGCCCRGHGFRCSSSHPPRHA